MSKPGTGLDLEDEEQGVGAESPATSATSTPMAMDDDVDFGNESEYKRPGDLDFIKVTQKNTFSRFSVLINPATGKAFMKKRFAHYVQGKGYAECLSSRNPKGQIVGEAAFCCKAGKEGQPRYAALVVEYVSIDPKTGKFIKDRGVEFELKVLGLSYIGYKEISLLPGEDDNGNSIPVTSLDVITTPKDDTKGLKYAKMSARATYTRDPALKAAVEAEMAPFLTGPALTNKIAKKLNKAELRIFLGVGTTGGDDGPGMDDLD